MGQEERCLVLWSVFLRMGFFEVYLTYSFAELGLLSRHDHPHRVFFGGQGNSCNCCTVPLPLSPPQSPLPVLPRQLQQSHKEQQPQCNSNSYLARDLHCNVTQQELFSCLCNGLSLGNPGTFAPMLV